MAPAKKGFEFYRDVLGSPKYVVETFWEKYSSNEFWFFKNFITISVNL